MRWQLLITLIMQIINDNILRYFHVSPTLTVSIHLSKTRMEFFQAILILVYFELFISHITYGLKTTPHILNLSLSLPLSHTHTKTCMQTHTHITHIKPLFLCVSCIRCIELQGQQKYYQTHVLLKTFTRNFEYIERFLFKKCNKFLLLVSLILITTYQVLEITDFDRITWVLRCVHCN
jgi:hypothetical protein